MSATERVVLSIAEVAAGRPLVERSAPGKAPTAFRIWAFGANACDGKTVVFSERSAEMLLAEQAARGRLYSFDFDHRSMMQDVSPNAGKSAGWHALEVREHEGKPELWAAGPCDWTAEARTGLEADPPEWRYFSPCYGTDPKTREVVSYVGCALTNNPLTHGIPALASSITPNGLRPFELHRDEDETGVSGTGIVAEGVVFADGRVVLRWKTATASTTLFDSVEQMMKVHGHDGKTRLVHPPNEHRDSGVASDVDIVLSGRLAMSRARYRVLNLRGRRS